MTQIRTCPAAVVRPELIDFGRIRKAQPGFEAETEGVAAKGLDQPQPHPRAGQVIVQHIRLCLLPVIDRDDGRIKLTVDLNVAAGIVGVFQFSCRRLP